MRPTADDTLFCSSLSMLCAISSIQQKQKEKLKENNSVKTNVEIKCSQMFNSVKIVLTQGSKCSVGEVIFNLQGQNNTNN